MKPPIIIPLNGTDGREYGYLDETSTVERTVKEAVNGDTVVSHY